jgi:hypothetical protein
LYPTNGFSHDVSGGKMSASASGSEEDSDEED